MSKTETGPHEFSPLRPWDRRKNGRCRGCFLPMAAHPVRNWAPSRPLGDRRKPDLWERLDPTPEATDG